MNRGTIYKRIDEWRFPQQIDRDRSRRAGESEVAAWLADAR